jgi:hypothetical protein
MRVHPGRSGDLPEPPPLPNSGDAHHDEHSEHHISPPLPAELRERLKADGHIGGGVEQHDDEAAEDDEHKEEAAEDDEHPVSELTWPQYSTQLGTSYPGLPC